MPDISPGISLDRLEAQGSQTNPKIGTEGPEAVISICVYFYHRTELTILLDLK